MNGAKKKLNASISKGAETTTYVKALANTHIELKKVELSQVLNKVFYYLLITAVVSVFCVGMAFFALIGLFYWLANYLNSEVQAAFLVVLVLLVVLGLFLLLGPLFKKWIGMALNKAFFQSSSAPEKEAVKTKIQKLEKLVQDSSQEIPSSVKGISFGDFMPGNIGSSTFWKKVGNSPISGWLASMVIAFAEKKIRKKK